MDSRHLVDPELLPMLEMIPRTELTLETLPTARSGGWPMPPAPPEAADQKIVRVPGPAGAPDVELFIYTPKGAASPLPCIYHVHGGGYVAGSCAAQEPAHRMMAHDLGCIIVSVEYRLAPETPYPGPVEDCYAGLSWTFDHAAEIGVDERRIGLMGESAGGGLAAALALMTRDRGRYRLSFQHLVYPMLDDRTCTRPDPHPTAGEFVWHDANNRFGWSSLLGHEPGLEDVSPYAAPARAEDLSGLPPTCISTGALDLFMEEDIEYARRLMRAGVPTELHVYPGAFHAFDFHPAAAVSHQARRDRKEHLARALHAERG
ncbi:MAG TPA: alpha/beta hydrolase [Caulobacteraceae bacterium]|jgi:triacylglycerol lipase|nr:alpha/beta hydrolase [Caulobacteraceae bacterium]